MLKRVRVCRNFASLMFVLLGMVPGKTIAQLNISGKPGLIYVPSARALNDGDFVLGGFYNPNRYSLLGINNRGSEPLQQNAELINSATLCFVPRLEVSLTLLNAIGYLPLNSRGIGDRQFDLKYQLLRETPRQPALALILSAPFGLNNSLITHAVVASKTVALTDRIQAEFTAGYGSPYYFDKSGGGDKYDFTGGYELRNKYKNRGRYLTGPFGGAVLRFDQRAGLMAEWDSKHLNVGGYVSLFDRWTLQAGLLNFDQVTLGTSYAVSLHKLPKRLTQPAEAPTRPERTRLNVENLTLDSTTKTAIYEQRLYRNPLVGLLELRSLTDSSQIDSFVPLHQGVPVARYRLANGVEAQALDAGEREALRQQAPFRPGRYKFDLRLQPEVIARFGFKQNPFETKTNLLLQTQLLLWRGMALNAGVAFALINDLDNERTGIRPAPLYLNQFLALGSGHYLSMSAGSFYNNQYGVNGQYRWTNFRSPWSFGVEGSLTGFYYFPSRGVYYEPLNQMMLFGDVAYRLPVHALTVKLSGGQYRNQERGARLDLIRQFANVEIGVFATKTAESATAGFNFAIPIPPGKVVQGRRVRLRTSEEFRWEYNYNGSANVGAPYRLGTRLDELLRQYHSDYWRTVLKRGSR